MNKRGLMGLGTNFVFGLVGLFVFMLVLVSMIGFQSGVELDKSLTVMDNLQKNFSIKFNPENLNATSYSSELTYSAIKVIYSMVDFVLYSTFEVTKAALKFAYENPDIVNPKVMLWIIMISLLAPIIIVLFKLGIIIFLLVKEYLQSKKEKMEIKEYKK